MVSEMDAERQIKLMREILIGALFAALGVIVPILFHLVGLGRVFLPMHLPILAAGFFVSPIVAAATGFVTPWVSSFLTGMPPLPTAVLMSLELPVLAGIASLCYRALRGRVHESRWIGKIIAVWSSTVIAVVARVAVDLLLLAKVVAPLLQLPVGSFGLAAVLAGAPGIVLQLTVVPAIVLAIERMGKERGLWTSES
ncbi:ECF transporter S component [Fervidibacter sacchari]